MDEAMWEMEMETIKVLIADDHPVIRQGIRALLETEEGIEVVSEASNGLEAIAKTGECQPDVVLMDIVMPGMDGLEATRHIRRQYPDINIIILTSYPVKAFVVDAIQAGAGGYLLKDSSRELLCRTVRAVTSGSVLIEASLLHETVATLFNSRMEYQEEMTGVLNDMEEFTDRERRILELLVDGRTNKEIGKELNISEETAKKHVQNIIAKLSASDRTQAAVRAVRIGLVREPTAESIETGLNSESRIDLPISSP